MKKKFSKSYMEKNCNCYTKERLRACSFMQQDIITIESILSSEIQLKDKYWFVIKKCCLTKREKQQIAINAILVTLSIFEKKYPDDLRPRQAIQAAQAYLNNEISREELMKKYNAFRNAYAAYAAYTVADANVVESILLENLKMFVNMQDEET